MNLVTEPVKMLDLALRWFAMDTKEILSKHPAVTREHVTQNDAAQSMVDFFPQLNNTEFLMYHNMIFDKLANDGYIKKVNELNSITFEGKLFSKSGGYEVANKKSAIRANLQSSQTWAIAVGTVLAGAYGLLEILKTVVRLCKG